MIERIEACVDCKYWECYDEKDLDKYGEVAAGSCHRYPPNVPCVADVSNVGTLIYEEPICGVQTLDHPTTFALDWCGEFSCAYRPRWED